MARLKIGDRVASGEPGTPEYDLGTVTAVVGRDGIGVRVYWEGARETYPDDASDLRRIDDISDIEFATLVRAVRS